MFIFNFVELLRSGNRFIWIFCNLLPRIFKVFWFNKYETTIINNTVTISKSEIFSAEFIKFHGVSHNGTFTVSRSWNKWFYYTPKPIRYRFSMAGFKIQSWQIVWPAAELGNCFDWFELLSTSIIELDEAYVWMVTIIELLDVISTVFNVRGIMCTIITDKYKVIFHNLFVMIMKCYYRVYSWLLNGPMNRLRFTW